MLPFCTLPRNLAANQFLISLPPFFSNFFSLGMIGSHEKGVHDSNNYFFVETEGAVALFKLKSVIFTAKMGQ